MADLSMKSYKSHESVRERNRREQRRFDQTSDGRYNEFKIKLNGISTQQRLVEKDLERIRAGVHRPPKSAIISSHKSFNPASTCTLAEKNLRNKQEKSSKKSPKRSPRPPSDIEKVEINTGMLVEYLQKLQEADVIDLDNIITDKVVKGTQLVNQKMNSDPEMSQRSTNQAERSGSFNNKQLNIPTIRDVNSVTRGSADSKLDLNSNSNRDQRLLKSSPLPTMSAPETGATLEKEQHSSQKAIYNSENSKGIDASTRRRKSSAAQDDFNGQIYNYDSFEFGNSKEQLNSDKQWEQARNARYVRTREKLERDRELSVKEIFDRSKP